MFQHISAVKALIDTGEHVDLHSLISASQVADSHMAEQGHSLASNVVRNPTAKKVYDDVVADLQRAAQLQGGQALDVLRCTVDVLR